jgi:type IV secretion system protein VirB10
LRKNQEADMADRDDAGVPDEPLDEADEAFQDEMPDEFSDEPLGETGEEQFELTPEKATGFEKNSGAPGVFNRGRVLKVICVAFAVIVGGGLLVNISRGNKKTTEAAESGRAARPPSDFLARELERSRRRPPDAPGGEDAALPALPEAVPVSLDPDSPAAFLAGPGPYAPPPPPQQQTQTGGGGRAQSDPLLAAYVSPLVPAIQGSFFAQDQGLGTPAAPGNQYYPESYPGSYAASEYQRVLQEAYAQQPYAQAPYAPAQDPYAAQNSQENKQAFYAGGTPGGGMFLDDSSLWTGTVIPAVLITAINTDLPGNTLARVTENIYDSKTGGNLLVPQGTILVARYNSSVSYAQHRVQIVWDTLIRPDGFFLELSGANGVDRKGMAGLEAEYHENWFEYLKAAGIIAMFSVANSRMTEEAAKYASDSAASGIAQANAEMVNELGGGIVGRAMNIQPTLTVENGTVINIMLNRTISLPPVPGYPVTRRYTR